MWISISCVTFVYFLPNTFQVKWNTEGVCSDFPLHACLGGLLYALSTTIKGSSLSASFPEMELHRVVGSVSHLSQVSVWYASQPSDK